MRSSSVAKAKLYPEKKQRRQKWAYRISIYKYVNWVSIIVATASVRRMKINMDHIQDSLGVSWQEHFMDLLDSMWVAIRSIRLLIMQVGLGLVPDGSSTSICIKKGGPCSSNVCIVYALEIFTCCNLTHGWWLCASYVHIIAQTCIVSISFSIIVAALK